MPIFKVGNFDQIGVQFNQTARVIKPTYKQEVRFPQTLSVDSLSEISFNIELPSMILAKSPKKWGLYIKSITLHKSFEGFIANIFNPKNEIYFTSITWDYSGRPPFVYPAKGADPSNFIIPMKSKDTREFIGNGINIWPSRIVVGGLNVAILIYECDRDIRGVGETLVEIHDSVSSSKLTGLIAAISTNPTLATGAAIGEVVNVLMGTIGNIMKRNHDDYVDLYEGTYGTDKPQASRVERYDHPHLTAIELDFTVS